LFEAYLGEPSQMPLRYRTRQPFAEGVADNVAGMTDRFALKEHARLTGTVLPWPVDRQGAAGAEPE
jgi:dGTPase